MYRNNFIVKSRYIIIINNINNIPSIILNVKCKGRSKTTNLKLPDQFSVCR